MELRLFQTLVETTPDAVIATSTEGEVIYWSPGAEQTFGYTDREALGRAMVDLIVPPDRLEEELAAQSAVLTGDDASFETLRRRKDGSLVCVSVSTRAVRDPDGRVSCIVTNKKDVTHLKVERDARLIEARYRDLLESTPDAIVIANNTGRIVFATGRFGSANPTLR